MAASNITIDDTSPLIQYDPAGAWTHSSGKDSVGQAYLNSTFSLTNVEGSTAKFSFTGTGFWVYGAKKPDYGQYVLLLDDEVTGYAAAVAKESAFGQILGGTSGLKDGTHTVVLMAAGGGPINIDAIMYESTDPQQINAIPGGPTPKSESSSNESASTGTQTPSASSAPQSSGRLSANPNAVAGPAGQPSADDGQPSGQDGQTVSAQSQASSTSQPTTQPNVDSSSKAVNNPSQTGQAERASSSPQIGGPSQAAGGLPTGAIIGIAVGAVASLLLLAALIFVCIRRRRTSDHRLDVALPSPTLPLQNPDTEGGYFFAGFGSAPPNPAPERYLAQSTPKLKELRLSQTSLGSGVTFQGRTSPYMEKDTVNLPRPMLLAAFRDSRYSTDAATLASPDGYTTEMSPKMTPTRPLRPPQLHLSDV